MANHTAAREQLTFIANHWLKWPVQVNQFFKYFRNNFVSSHLASRFSPISYIGSQKSTVMTTVRPHLMSDYERKSRDYDIMKVLPLHLDEVRFISQPLLTHFGTVNESENIFQWPIRKQQFSSYILNVWHQSFIKSSKFNFNIRTDFNAG